MSNKIRKILLIVALVAMVASLLSLSVFAQDEVVELNQDEVAELSEEDDEAPQRDAVGDLNRDGTKDENDAIHLLNYSIFGGDFANGAFDIDQPSDYNGDGVADENDAIYLLNNIIFDGILDSFHICDHTDTWAVTEVVAPTCAAEGYTLVTCSCGKTEKINPTPKTDDHNYDWDNPNTDNQATCLENGYITATCTVCGDVATEQQQATGHSFTEGTCTEGPACTKCGATEPARGHVYGTTPVNAVPATCKGGYNEYKCEYCDATHREELEPVDHRVEGEWVEAGQVAVEGKLCTFVYVEQATCADCGETLERTTKEFTKHTETTKVTLATCVTPGTKTVSCTVCSKVLSETSIAVPESDAEKAHKWDDGVVDGSVTTFTCQNEGCGKTKTTVKATEDGKVDIGAAEEVELDNGAAIVPDDSIKEQFGGKDVSVSIGEVKAEDLENLSDENKELLKELGDAPVFDLSMTADGENVTSFGENNKMTVRLPYTLAEGDDPDCIIIWYISDEGNISYFEAKYVDGYAVFETDHFSYYTVTRMTPAQRCAAYGHNNQTTTIPATCVTGGYDLTICTRCGHKEISNETVALGHRWTAEETKAPTCTETGIKHYTCLACEIEYEETLKAIGHSYKAEEEHFGKHDRYKAPTCTEKGEHYMVCEHCAHEYKEELSQRGHEYETEDHESDCEKGGYKHHKCKHCSHEYDSDHKKPHGHKYNKHGKCEHCGGECKHEYQYGVCKHCKHEKEKPVKPEPPQPPKPEEPECEHKFTYTYEFLNENLRFCEYGVIITETCANCGERRTFTTFECFTWTVSVDLSGYGHCGNHNFDYVMCPCGSELDWLGDVGLENEFETEDGKYGAKCDKCDMYALITRNYSEDKCGEYLEQTIEFYFGDKAIHSMFFSLSEEEHVLENVKVTFMDGASSCEGGVIVKGTCAVCGRSIEYKLYDHHPVVATKVDLTQYGACEHHSVIVAACACGKEKDVFVRGFDHSTSSSNDIYTRYCKECGVSVERVTKQSEKNEHCAIEVTETYTIYSNKEAKESFTVVYTQYEHEYVIKAELAEGSKTCEDGIIVTRICQRCGDSYSETNYGHYNQHKTLDLSEYGACKNHNVTVYGCVCCDRVEWLVGYDYMYSEDTRDGHISRCYDCGLTITSTKTKFDKDENCRRDVTEITVISCKGTEILTMTEEYNIAEHNYEYSGKFMEGSSSCEEGIIINRTCKDCGDTHTYESYGHTYEDFYVDLSGYGACSSHEIRLTKCVGCDRIDWFNAPGFEWIESEDGIDRRACAKCGINIAIEATEGATVGSCTTVYSYTITIYAGETVIDTLTAKEFYESHDYEYSYELMEGSISCEDGVVVNRTCKICGYTETYETYGHEFNEEYIDLSKYGACEYHNVHGNKCNICGQFDWISIDNYCYESIPNGEKYYCEKCDLVMIRTQISGEKNEHCEVKFEDKMVLMYGDVEIMTAIGIGWTLDHNYEYSFEFLGENKNCEEGVVINSYCADCGNKESWTQYGHEVFEYDRLSTSDYGHTCGTGYVIFYSCACGRENWTGGGFPGFNSYRNDQWVGDVYHNIIVRECDSCGYKLTCDEFTEKNEYCDAIRHTTYIFGNGETISYEQNIGKDHNTTQKDLPEESFVIENGDGSWTEVSAREYYCADCFASIEKRVYSYVYDANDNLVSRKTDYYTYVAVSEEETISVLDRTITVYYVTVNNTIGIGTTNLTLSEEVVYYNESGNSTSWERYEYVYENADYCNFKVVYSNSDGGNGIEYIEGDHRQNVSKYVLCEGSKSCMDGVVRVYVCVLCGVESSRNDNIYTRHQINISDTMLSERVDLKQYGAVCDTYLSIYTCACGEKQEIRVSGECEFDSHTYWRIDETGIEHRYTVYTCAVTDPKTCGFKYVVDRWYTTDESCNEICNYTYYMGVNETYTDYLTAYGTSYATGEKRHAEFETVENIDDTHYWSTTSCTICGRIDHTVEIADNVRTYTIYYYNDNGTLNYINIEKTLYPSRNLEIWLLDRYEYFDADGNVESWSQTEYIYPYAKEGDYCTLERVETNSNGYYYSEIRDNHNWYWNGWACTPDLRDCYCDKCGRTEQRMMGGSGHNFNYNSDKGVYVCNVCGLESAAGGNGNVVFEDRTTKEGNGKEYIIGWYNNYGESYLWNVSLVVEGVDDFIILDGIQPEVIGEYRLRLDATKIAEAAKALGYANCGYMVRLAFVPTDSNGSLDYAITLDPHVYILMGTTAPEGGCDSGKAYTWTYQCVFCSAVKTEEEYGHRYDRYRIVALVSRDEIGHLVITYESGNICGLCGESYLTTEISTYYPNGQLLRTDHTETNGSRYVIDYEYDYVNGIVTTVLKHKTEGYVETEKYYISDNTFLYRYIEYTDGSWSKYEYDYDKANDQYTTTETRSDGYKRIFIERISNGEDVYSCTLNSDGSSIEYHYIYINGKRYNTLYVSVGADESWSRTESVYNLDKDEYTSTQTRSDGYKRITTRYISKSQDIYRCTWYADGRIQEYRYVYYLDNRYTSEETITSADSSWYKRVYDYDFANDVHVLTYTNSLGETTVNKYRTSTGEEITGDEPLEPETPITPAPSGIMVYYQNFNGLSNSSTMADIFAATGFKIPVPGPDNTYNAPYADGSGKGLAYNGGVGTWWTDGSDLSPYVVYGKMHRPNFFELQIQSGKLYYKTHGENEVFKNMTDSMLIITDDEYMSLAAEGTYTIQMNFQFIPSSDNGTPDDSSDDIKGSLHSSSLGSNIILGVKFTPEGATGTSEGRNITIGAAFASDYLMSNVYRKSSWYLGKGKLDASGLETNGDQTKNIAETLFPDSVGFGMASWYGEELTVRVVVRGKSDNNPGYDVYMKRASDSDDNFVYVGAFRADTVTDTAMNFYQSDDSDGVSIVCRALNKYSGFYLDDIAIWTGSGDMPADTSTSEYEKLIGKDPEAPEEPEVPTEPKPDSDLTIKEAIALGTSKEHNTYTEGKYYVTGTIIDIQNDKYGNMYISDGENVFFVYGVYSADGAIRFDGLEIQPKLGDTITVYGIIGQYNGAPQMKNAAIAGLFICDPEPNSTLTIAYANALGLCKAHNTYTEGKYYVTGTITEINNDKYGNVYITDGTNTFYIYGLYNADGTVRYDSLEAKPQVGDTITVYGIIGQYNGNPQIKNGWIVSHDPAEPKPECKHVNYVVEKVVESSCGVSGYISCICTDCGNRFISEVFAPLAHIFEVKSMGQDTCEKEADIEYVCAYCGVTELKLGAAKDGKCELSEPVEQIVETDIFMVQFCSVCKTEFWTHVGTVEPEVPETDGMMVYYQNFNNLKDTSTMADIFKATGFKIPVPGPNNTGTIKFSDGSGSTTKYNDGVGTWWTDGSDMSPYIIYGGFHNPNFVELRAENGKLYYKTHKDNGILTGVSDSMLIITDNAYMSYAAQGVYTVQMNFKFIPASDNGTPDDTSDDIKGSLTPSSIAMNIILGVKFAPEGITGSNEGRNVIIGSAFGGDYLMANVYRKGSYYLGTKALTPTSFEANSAQSKSVLEALFPDLVEYGAGAWYGEEITVRIVVKGKNDENPGYNVYMKKANDSDDNFVLVGSFNSETTTAIGMEWFVKEENNGVAIHCRSNMNNNGFYIDDIAIWTGDGNMPANTSTSEYEKLIGKEPEVPEEPKPECKHENLYAEVIAEPNCVNAGERILSCMDCAAVLERNIIPAFGHHYDEANATVISGSCQANILYIYACINSGCDEYKAVMGEFDTTPAGHMLAMESAGNVATPKILREASCTVKGLFEYTCTQCNITYTETVDYAECVYGEPYEKTIDGVLYIVQTCGVCQTDLIIKKVVVDTVGEMIYFEDFNNITGTDNASILEQLGWVDNVFDQTAWTGSKNGTTESAKAVLAPYWKNTGLSTNMALLSVNDGVLKIDNKTNNPNGAYSTFAVLSGLALTGKDYTIQYDITYEEASDYMWAGFVLNGGTGATVGASRANLNGTFARIYQNGRVELMYQSGHAYQTIANEKLTGTVVEAGKLCETIFGAGTTTMESKTVTVRVVYKNVTEETEYALATGIYVYVKEKGAAEFTFASYTTKTIDASRIAFVLGGSYDNNQGQENSIIGDLAFRQNTTNKDPITIDGTTYEAYYTPENDASGIVYLDNFAVWTGTGEMPGSESDTETPVEPNPECTHPNMYVGKTEEPTCNKYGLITYICPECGVASSEVLEPLGHEYTITYHSETCEKEADKEYSCVRCKDFYIEVGNAKDGKCVLGHPVEQTLGNDIFMIQTCGVCKTEYWTHIGTVEPETPVEPEIPENQFVVDAVAAYTITNEKYYNPDADYNTHIYRRQGGCFNGTNAYHAYISKNQELAVIVKKNVETGEVIYSEPRSDLGHANDMTYSSKTNCVYVVTGMILHVFDADTLEYKGSEKLGKGASGISYNAYNDTFVGFSGGTVSFYDASYQLINGFALSDRGVTSQGICTDEKYIYVLYCTSLGSENYEAYVYIYDYEGKYINTITVIIPDTREPENISIVDGVLYIGACTAQPVVTFFRVEIPAEIFAA